MTIGTRVLLSISAAIIPGTVTAITGDKLMVEWDTRSAPTWHYEFELFAYRVAEMTAHKVWG